MIRVGFKSDRGQVKRSNQDACFVMPKEQVYIVADGVGGELAGERASYLAVASIADSIKKRPIENIEEEDLSKYMKNLVEKANKHIIERSLNDASLRGMATTVVAAYIRNDKAYLINAGDSRGYIYRDGTLVQITNDHSYVGELVRKGVMTSDEADNHPENNIIKKALGAMELVNPEFYSVELNDEDIILLCTDGVFHELDHNQIRKIIKVNKDANKIAEELIIEANHNGGRDNITVVCLKVDGGF
ncbi:MAG: Stp1/IreP family PP2C-type Ser/Thr phosphatase [Eubacteriales bacterium]|nr:Stp1/IreP family PP2C-type Ser/Thr phosphatase [Eubacteriales bacterium]MDY3332787.1 Stp1/IreP family PP2C-type Ser/Thr phosphatase [Gallibacter sp.]